uniref:G_PROTEIN_RECEP_F1_2 domain-containing protein n=1 Tax=Strongyloides papillosus TaxID=174720 RepID=A0A0N5BPF3_STREA
MDICEDAYNTTANPLIVSIWVGLIIQNILCIFGLLLLSFFLIYYKIYHFNLRILILSLHLAFLIRTFGTTYRGFNFLINIIFKGDDNCNLLQTKSYCIIVSTLNILPINVFLYSFAVISIERIIASIFYKIYEKKSFIILPFIGIIVIWFHPIFKACKVLTDPSLSLKNEKLPYCNSFATKTSNVIRFIRNDLPVCFIVFLLNIIIYIYCRKRLKNLDDTNLMDKRLTVKLELREILSTTVLMTTLAISYTIDIALNTALIYILSITEYTDNRSFAIDKELSAYIIPVYILIYIGIFILLSDKIKQKTVKIFGKMKNVASKNNVKVASTNEVEKYFQIYKNKWVLIDPSLPLKNEKLPYCNSFATKTSNPMGYIKNDLPVCFAVFLFNIIIYIYCRKRLKSLDDTKLMDNRLTIKFELREILSTTVLMTILAILYTIDVTLNTLFVYILYITEYTDNRSFAIDKELSAYIIPWFQPVFKACKVLTDPSLFLNDEKLSYCNSFATKTSDPIGFIQNDLPFCFAVFFLNIIIYIYCRKRLKSLDDTKLMDNRLTVKFVLREILSTTVLMTILAILYTIDITLNTIFEYILYNTEYTNNRSFAIDKELSAYVIPVYLLIYIGIFISLSNKIKQKIIKVLLKVFICNMDICEDAYNTTSNPVIISIWIGLIIQNIPCIFGLLMISFFLIYYKIYHFHLRILIVSLHFAFLIRTVGTTYRGFYFLIKLILKGDDNCNLLQKKSNCVIISTINSSFVSVFLYTFAAISVERIIASIFYKKYEKRSIIILPFIAIIAIWFKPVLTAYKTLTNSLLYSKNQELPYCNSFATILSDPTSYMKSELPLCIIVFLLNITIYFYCRKRIKSLDDTKLIDNRLTVKFELREILSTTVLMTILAIFYSINLALNTTIVYILSTTKYKDNRSFAIDKELSAYVIPVYLLIYIGIFISLSDKIKQKTIKIFCKTKKHALNKNNKVTPTNEIEKYFEIYKNTWA